ncbi:peroxisomal 2,4-dienoyl-CoA reductase SPS19 [Cadophora sp. MPI-SDFR-AT-0126]|nr:peroxisomal 2,4-dienoyl-CoA reductase SPS19 [Leptodontidium sp. MPI-SDFR-AT-0119]KAH7418872.1 peroxisomal 2,4-dienoyl-CoA reductase SPS19 [Leotiomycetes sp. MPI-SDFR-AT-0126]
MSDSNNNYVSTAWRRNLFDKKVVFCTGGAGTICSGQVRALVYLGANACIIGRNVEKTELMAKDICSSREGAKVIGIGGIDVRSIESLLTAVARCVDELGGIDFVIAGAAGNFLAPFMQLSSNAFKAVMDIDVLGSYNTAKAVLPHLLVSAASHKSESGTASPKGTGGRIIFVSATIHYTGLPLQTHVAAAKAAVDQLSNSLAIELGPRGITSNTIAPGPIAETEGIKRLSSEADSNESGKAVPLGRFGTVKDIADATVWLFSDAANFVNGSTVVVDGGAWRMGRAAGPGASFSYPDFLLSGEAVSGVVGAQKANL